MRMGRPEDLQGCLAEVVNDGCRRGLLAFILHAIKINGATVRQGVEAIEGLWVALLASESKVDPLRQETGDKVGF